MSMAIPYRITRPDAIDTSLCIPFIGTLSAGVLMGLKSLGYMHDTLESYSFSEIAAKGVPFWGSYLVAKDISQSNKIKKIFDEATRAERLSERACHFATVSRTEPRINDLAISEWKEMNSKLVKVLTLLEKSMESESTAKDDKLAQESAFHALVAIKGKKAFNTASSAINASKCIAAWRGCYHLAKEFRGVPVVECALARVNEAKEKGYKATRSALVDAMQTVELKLYI